MLAGAGRTHRREVADEIRSARHQLQTHRRQAADEVELIALPPGAQGKDRPLTWHPQELFVTPDVRNNLHLKVGTWHKVLPVADGFLTFLKIKGIEPAINDAEGALLPSLIRRKLSNSVQSLQGEICRSLLTVTTTLRQQGRDNWQLLE